MLFQAGAEEDSANRMRGVAGTTPRATSTAARRLWSPTEGPVSAANAACVSRSRFVLGDEPSKTPRWSVRGAGAGRLSADPGLE